MKKLIFLLFAPLLLQAQSAPPAASVPKPTTAGDRLKGLDNRQACDDRSLVNNVSFRNVGPSVMSGRVVDIDVDPSDPTIFYVAYASGGVWFTNNNGTTFHPVFDQQSMIDIGDIAVNWNNNIAEDIWVGTGECNSSRSSYSGTGMYHSSDGGKTWENKGLTETHHIGKVLISPKDKNTVYVAAIGHLYTPSKERGLFKTTDGGKTWKQILFIDETTGVIDLFMDPGNENILYAISWHRERKAWNFVESGATSGIYKTTNAGETFAMISGPKSGLPQGDGVGRMGLNIFSGNSNVLFLILDNQSTLPDTTVSKDLTPLELRKMTKAQFLEMDPARLMKFLKENSFPDKYSTTTVLQMVRTDKILPSALADYISDANSDLFSKPIIGAEIYRSDDAGSSWKKVNVKSLDGLFYTYGYYFGKIWVSPFDQNEIYIAGVELLKSTDGGKNFQSTNGENQHGDHHAFWIDPKRKGHLINGNDGGINISWDAGATWFKANTPAVGQFYSVNVDMATPYNVYGGLQDNGVWCGPSNYHPDLSWYDSGQYPFRSILGGDGMQVQVDTRDNNTIYSGYQFGHYFRINKRTGETKELHVEMELGDQPLRFNWQAPILLSPHNQDILYFAGQRLYRSLDKGDHFVAISGDLTRGAKTGDVPYGTITTISESPKKFGLIYTGSDDGLIYVTKNGGESWTRISDKLPQNLRVNRVIASSFVEGRVYVVMSGFHWDNFHHYLYVSEDFGATWKEIGNGLPMEPLNVLREDPVNQNLLFVGSDQGLYTSFDRGQTFMRMNNGLPPVAIHDLMIQTREHDLVVGTHGRSIYIANISELEMTDENVLKYALFAYQPGPVQQYQNYTTIDGAFSSYSASPVKFASFSAAPIALTYEVYSADGKFLFTTIKDTSEKGLNFLETELLVDSINAPAYKEWAKSKQFTPKAAPNGKYALEAGTYLLKVMDYDANISEWEFIIRGPVSSGEPKQTPLAPDEMDDDK